MSFFTLDRDAHDGMTIPATTAAAAAFAPAMFMLTAWSQAMKFWLDAGVKAMAGFAPANPAENSAVRLSPEATPSQGAFSSAVHVSEDVASPAVETAVDAVFETPMAVANLSGVKPNGLPAAREGGADDLKMISGVGPKIEAILHSLGIFHFDQIAAWKSDEVEWVDAYLNFKGRILRDEWVAQADALAAGGRDEYVRRFGKEPR